MKMTVEQFKIFLQYDQDGKFELIEKEFREEYLGTLRLMEVKQAGIEISEVPNDDVSNHSTDRLLSKTRARGLRPTNQLDDAEKSKQELGETVIRALCSSRSDDTADSVCDWGDRSAAARSFGRVLSLHHRSNKG